MNNEIFNEDAYNRINSLKVPQVIAKELAKYSPDFVAEYRKYGNMLRNKKFREQNKDTINAKRKISRSLNKPIETIPTIIDPDNVDTSIVRDNKQFVKIKELNPNTLNNYISVIKNIYSKYHNEPLSDDADILKLLRNEKYDPKKLLKNNMYIVDNIKDIALNYPAYLNILHNIFSRLNGKNLKILRDTIYPYAIEYKKAYTDNRDKAIVNTDLTDKISFDTADVIANSKKIDNIYDKLIYLLSFLIPTRRLYDYRICRIAYKAGDLNDLNYNWYYQGNIYINNTKNKDRIVLELPYEINAIVNQLPNDTDYILGKLYSQSTLSHKFNIITKNIYDTPFGALEIRKLYATYNLKTGAETGNTKLMKANARLMGHSLGQSMDYVVKT